jgi:hypothetical protein
MSYDNVREDNDKYEAEDDDANDVDDNDDFVDDYVMNDDDDGLEEINDSNNVIENDDDDVGYSGGVADLINGSYNANGDSYDGGSYEVATVFRWHAP